jgi:hypothetical protein
MDRMQEIVWFSPEVRPVNVGVYMTEIQYECGPIVGFSFWDGRVWGNQCKTVLGAEAQHDSVGEQHKRWCGLNKQT